jgi:hypothetical protein
MPRKRKVGKKPYTLPSFRALDAEAAEPELEAKGESDDPHVQKMIRAIDQKLSPDKEVKSTLDKSA